MTDVLVTGGSGFSGSNLVIRLVRDGKSVRVFDSNDRGTLDNLAPVLKDVEFIRGDIRDAQAVANAMNGVHSVFHLAYVNGTQFFYSMPGRVLDVAVRGQLNAIDGALKAGVESFIYASSSEVYQTPTEVPTGEDVCMIVPEVKNPRYSYGGGKIISELLLQFYAPAGAMRRVTFRPHNVYGPAMGFEHVIPQIIEQMHRKTDGWAKRSADLEIQGSGRETRAFCFVEDAVEAILLAADKGGDGEIFNVGTEDEISIAHLIRGIAEIAGIEAMLRPGLPALGGTPRRCPSIAKLAALGYRPRVDLRAGLARTVPWYQHYFATRAA